MTPTECVQLMKFIGARCPAMRMQEDTPEAWYVDLVGFDLADAMEAARIATLDSAFIAVGDLVREAEAIVRRRIGRQRVAEREAEIAAENAGDTDPEPVTAGGPGVPLALTSGPLHERLSLVEQGRREAIVAAEQRTRRQALLQQAREARRAKRAEIEAELERVRAKNAEDIKREQEIADRVPPDELAAALHPSPEPQTEEVSA